MSHELTMPCVIKLVVSNFDVHAWSSLIGDLFLPARRIVRPPARKGIVRQRFVEPNLHELRTFLTFEDFDAAAAHGGSVAHKRSASIVTKLEATWTHGASDTLLLKVWIATVEGAGIVSVDPATDDSGGHDSAQLPAHSTLDTHPSVC